MILVLLLGCAPDPETIQGHLIDARSDQPVPEAELRFTAQKNKCPEQRTTTDAKGRFSISGLCGKAAWTVAPTDLNWYLPAPVVTGPDLTGPELTVRAWRAPETPGVYLLTGTVVTPLVTNTVLDVVRVFDTDREVRFPVELPGVPPRIHADVTLLVVGSVLSDPLPFEPLVPSLERRWFGTKEVPKPVDPWVYLGVRFESDAVVEDVAAPIDPAGIERVEGPRPLQYVSGSALAPGRYALPTLDKSRAFILDFGPPTKTPTEAAPSSAAPPAAKK